jgi:hypothetical protein
MGGIKYSRAAFEPPFFIGQKVFEFLLLDEGEMD